MNLLFKNKLAQFSRTVFIILCILLFSTGVSNAAHYDGQCITELNAVELAIENANFVGKRAETNRSNLLAKLEAANAKITLLKYSDAVDKLADISDTATTLASAPKQKLEDATDINDATKSAISCTGLLL